MTRFDGKSAIITGGAGGIGSATCRRFAGEGARVAVFDRDEAGAQKVAREIEAAGGKAQAFACDITDRPSVDAAVAASESALGPVAILVNNAGFDIFKPGLGSVRCSAFLRGRRRTRTEVSACGSLCFRETEFCRQRQRHRSSRWIRSAVRRDQAPARAPANWGPFAKSREISVRMGLFGGPGRTRTSNQAVMSALPSPELSINIGVFARVR